MPLYCSGYIVRWAAIVAQVVNLCRDKVDSLVMLGRFAKLARVERAQANGFHHLRSKGYFRSSVSCVLFFFLWRFDCSHFVYREGVSRCDINSQDFTF